MISKIEVFLDDNMPDYMEGLIRIGSINCYDNNDEVLTEMPDGLPRISDLVDNGEFRSESDLKKWVAKQLEISTEYIEIID